MDTGNQYLQSNYACVGMGDSKVEFEQKKSAFDTNAIKA